MPPRRIVRVSLREIALIVGVAGGLALIGRANLRATARESAAVTCVSNMRTILREAALYAGAGSAAEATVGVAQLERAGVVTERVGRCPLGGSGGSGGDDYLVTFRNGRPVAVVCTVAPHDHVLAPRETRDGGR